MKIFDKIRKSVELGNNISSTRIIAYIILILIILLTLSIIVLNIIDNSRENGDLIIVLTSLLSHQLILLGVNKKIESKK